MHSPASGAGGKAGAGGGGALAGAMGTTTGLAGTGGQAGGDAGLTTAGAVTDGGVAADGTFDGAVEGGAATGTKTPAVLRTKNTSQYVTVGGDGSLSATGESASRAEVFTVVDLNGGTLGDGDVVLLAAQGKYLSAADGGGSTVAASASQAGDHETFVIRRVAGAGAIANGEEVAFKVQSSDYYLSADMGGGGAVLANQTHMRTWETFTLYLNGMAPTTSAAGEAKKKALAYFSSISGKKTIFGIENKGSLHADTDQVRSLVGKQPGLWGNDFGFGSAAVNQRPAMAQEAIRQWNAGALVGLMYHACAPTRDELCGWDDVGGAHPQHLTSQQWSDITTPGTAMYKAWIGRLDALSEVFQMLKDAGVAPLFRPFHEMNQCVFWWSCNTSSAKLYQLTHDYLVNTKGFDNIIWVWNVQDFDTLSTDVNTYDPGGDYFDVAALDVYNTGYTSGNYNAMVRAAGGKPMAIGECQFMPSQATLTAQPNWLFAMLWPDFYGDNDLPTLYSAPSVLTEDEMPGWK